MYVTASTSFLEITVSRVRIHFPPPVICYQALSRLATKIAGFSETKVLGDRGEIAWHTATTLRRENASRDYNPVSPIEFCGVLVISPCNPCESSDLDGIPNLLRNKPLVIACERQAVLLCLHRCTKSGDLHICSLHEPHRRNTSGRHWRRKSSARQLLFQHNEIKNLPRRSKLRRTFLVVP